ncbi:thioredoxin reductase (NADPH) [Desulfohalotomaculum tongense]|uniref:NAD(P)/FAD-dependent oxidoreductase n=1 Tax=Desulforadius tongensis TaxID=1216062 RepID=UPI003B75C7DD|nr:thioredoxin reductase (NADPH) [Desulforadius tongensis]
MNETNYEIAIIGCGPAGLSAAINTKVRGKKLVLLGSEFCTPKLHKAPHVNNYLGFHSIGGEELRQKFLGHVKAMGIEILRSRVTGIIPQDDGFAIQARDKIFYARAVVLATGVSVAKLLPGEEEKLGLGVSYCATCDGGLYRNRTVAVLAYSPEGIEEANYLAGICRKVYLLPLCKGSQEMRSKIHEQVEVIADQKPLSIEGDNLVSALKLSHRTLEVEGVFIIRDAVLPDKLVPGLEIENGAVKINRDLSTNIPGLYAAGDNTGQPYQLAKAVGEGQVAALNAVKYIDNK